MKLALLLLGGIALGLILLAGTLAVLGKPVPSQLWGASGLGGVVVGITSLAGPHLDKALPPRKPQGPPTVDEGEDDGKP